MAWRNGLAALLAGLIGFGLIRGRSDISTLAGRWPLSVGLLLLAALAVGSCAAFALMRAAHGVPSIVPAQSFRSIAATTHAEALSAARALRRGVALTGVCALLLVMAVGATWYGPAAQGPVLRITTPAGNQCGVLMRSRDNTWVVTNGKGEATLKPGEILAVKPADGCLDPGQAP